MKKSVISYFLVGICLGSLLIGCGASSEDISKTSSEGTSENETIESIIESTEEITETTTEESTEETTVESIEATTEEYVGNVYEDIDKKIDESTFVGKQYTYEKNGFGGKGHFIIYIDDNGTFTYREGDVVESEGAGVWEINGNIVTLRETIHTNRVKDTTNHFYMRDGNLVFIKTGSTQFLNIKNVKAGAVFYGNSWSKVVYEEDPFQDIYQEIKRPDLVQKQFTYEGKGYGGVGKFVIYFYEDNTYSYVQGDLAKLIGSGTWEIVGNTVLLEEEDTVKNNGKKLINRFHMKDGHLLFVEKGASQFLSIKTVKNGERFFGEIFEWE